MKKRSTEVLLRREEALILAWIGEVTREKQTRMLEIRRRLRLIARAERENRKNLILAQPGVIQTITLESAK